jgi:hypothetical protein
MTLFATILTTIPKKTHTDEDYIEQESSYVTRSRKKKKRDNGDLEKPPRTTIGWWSIRQSTDYIRSCTNPPVASSSRAAISPGRLTYDDADARATTARTDHHRSYRSLFFMIASPPLQMSLWRKPSSNRLKNAPFGRSVTTNLFVPEEEGEGDGAPVDDKRAGQPWRSKMTKPPRYEPTRRR